MLDIKYLENWKENALNFLNILWSLSSHFCLFLTSKSTLFQTLPIQIQPLVFQVLPNFLKLTSLHSPNTTHLAFSPCSLSNSTVTPSSCSDRFLKFSALGFYLHPIFLNDLVTALKYPLHNYELCHQFPDLSAALQTLYSICLLDISLDLITDCDTLPFTTNIQPPSLWPVP